MCSAVTVECYVLYPCCMGVLFVVCCLLFECVWSVCSEYGGLSKSGLCVFRELCPVSFLVVGECPSVISYVNCGDDEYVVG